MVMGMKVAARCRVCGTGSEDNLMRGLEGVMCLDCIADTWHVCFIDDSTCADCGGAS